MKLGIPLRYVPRENTFRMPGPQPPLGDGKYVEVDDQLDHYRSTKKLVAERWPPCRAAGMEEDERAVARWLREKADPDLFPAGGTRAATLDELVSFIQEDLVIMRKAENALPSTATADYLNVAFPSGWCPRCALQETFEGVHRRVPEDGTFTHRNRPGRAAFLFKREPTVRFAWTLTADKSLDRRKCHAIANHGSAPPVSWRDDVRNLYLRIERQVIAPIDQRLSVFLIRVYLYDVTSLKIEERACLRDSVSSMSSEVALYKGFIDERGDHRKAVAALLTR
jgi:hypothetical protein